MKPAGLSVHEAHERTGYHREWIRRLCRQGKIKAEIVGQVYFINEESLLAYADSMKEIAGPRPRK